MIKNNLSYEVGSMKEEMERDRERERDRDRFSCLVLLSSCFLVFLSS